MCDHMDLSGPRELEALPDEKPGVNRYLLRLQGVTAEDVGEHFCSATNKFGTAKESFSLTREFVHKVIHAIFDCVNKSK